MTELAWIGIGGYGEQLMERVLAAEEACGCRLAAAADAHLADLPEQAAALRERGVELYDDALEMMRRCRGRCRAIYITTGIGSHSVLTIAAATAGFHIHLEKPPAATIQELDQMLQALDRSRRMCMVGFQNIHSPEMAFLQERIAAGAIGEVQTVTCQAGWYRDRAYYERNGWAGRLRAQDNWVLDGPATNALAHQVMNMLLLAGGEPCRPATPVSVRAELYAAGLAESHDTAAIEIQTLEGPRLVWLGSHCSQDYFGPVIRVIGSEGTAQMQIGQGARLTGADGQTEQVEGDCGWEAMIRHFLARVAADDATGLRGALAQTRPFVLAVNGAHESSGRIHRIGPEHVAKLDEGTPAERTVLAGVDELIRTAADKAALFQDLPDRPAWVVRTPPYRLTGYGFFPDRFELE